jgi:hypothetical protein
MDIGYVILVKLAIVCFLLSIYNLFSCSVSSPYVVTNILCLQSGMCGIAFRYYNNMYSGFIVTKSTPPLFDLYYYPFSPRYHCFKPTGSIFAGYCFLFAGLILLCVLLPRRQRLPKITEHALEIRSDQSVSIGVSSSNALVIITGP